MDSGAENVVPASSDRLKTNRGAPVLLLEVHTKKIPPDETTAITTSPATAGPLIGTENVAPPSVERLKKMRIPRIAVEPGCIDIAGSGVDRNLREERRASGIVGKIERT